METYQAAYPSPPSQPYFSPRFAALVMLFAKIQVTRTLAVNSAVEGAAPSRERAQRNPRWCSARGATTKTSAPYPTSASHCSQWAIGTSARQTRRPDVRYKVRHRPAVRKLMVGLNGAGEGAHARN